MASSNETGHAKNVANLQTLVTYLESLDGKYNPTKASLKLDALKTLYTSASKSMDDYSNAKPAYSAAVDAQEAAFKPLDKLLTRVVKAYKAGVDDPASAETIVGIKKKMTGAGSRKEAGTENDAATDAPKERSTSQRSYDNRLAHFADIIKVLEATPDYQPAEDELKVSTLKSLYADLLKKTQAVDAAEAPVINARIRRNKSLYDSKTGLFDVVAGVKDYVASVYGAGSPEVKYINQLKFTNK